MTTLEDRSVDASKKEFPWRGVAAWLVVLLSTVFVATILNPKFLWNTNTVGGGDSGGTLLAAHYMSQSLLPHGMVTGWSNWWFKGYPAYVFYFPLPAVVTSLLGYVVGFNVAAHWCLMGPAIALPAAMYFFGRLVRLGRWVPELLCVGAIGFLLEPTWAVSGGNLNSLFTGEYSYAWAIPVGLIAVGLLWRAINTAKYRGWAALAFVATILCHIVVGVAVGLLGLIMLCVVGVSSNVTARERRARLMVALPAMVVGVGLSLWWLLPFVVDTPYSNSVNYGKNKSYGALLMPGQTWLIVLAGVGIGFAVTRGWRVVRVLGLGALVLAGLFIYLPQSSPIWNERFYPLYVLLIWILGAVGAGSLVLLSQEKLAKKSSRAALRALPGLVLTLGASAIVAFGWLATGWAPFGATPASQEIITNSTWLHSSNPAYYRNAATTALSGLQSASKWKLLNSGYQAIEKAGELNGCGAIETEYLPLTFGTGYPWGLLSLDSKGCLSVADGPFFESSVTRDSLAALTPLISTLYPSTDIQSGIDTGAPENLTTGVNMMQALGIKYYVAYEPHTTALAAKQPDLTLVSVLGIWHVYLVKDAPPVAPAQYQPIVLTGPGAANADWGLTGAGYIKVPGIQLLTFLQSGESSWAKVAVPSVTNSSKVNVHLPTLVKEPKVTVTKYKTTNDTISFHVSRVGVPIEIKTSYFPNWHVTGAQGIYRSVPNFMVVVPTSKDVTLYYGQTPIDMVGDYATWLALLGLLGLFVLDYRSTRTDWLEETPANFSDGGDSNDGGANTDGKQKLLQRRFLTFEGKSRKSKTPDLGAGT